MLTPEQRAEGRLLIENYNNADHADYGDQMAYDCMADWFNKHGPDLLAEPPAVDVEAIKRDAVRDFAKKLLSFQRKVLVGTEYFQVVLVSGIRAACTARGVKLDEKP